MSAEYRRIIMWKKPVAKIVLALMLVGLLGGCVILQSESYTQTARIPLGNGTAVAYETRPEKTNLEALVEPVNTAMVIREIGDGIEGCLKALTLPFSGVWLNTAEVKVTLRRFVWIADEPLPPITEPEKVKINEKMVEALLGLRGE